MTNKVDFRYNDMDFIAYLLTVGYEYTSIEVALDNRTNKLKGFMHFEGDKNELLDLYNQYKNEELLANVVQMKNNRKKANMLIKSEIIKYQANKF